ncbi:MAG: hypothetical protein LZF86_230009 [Nitrospira sp.]|nr:MAG: hypothetical protein LZF86_230009 [Nitrospira sp.]
MQTVFLRKPRLPILLGAFVLLHVAMLMDFSIESSQASDDEKLLAQTDLYRVTASDKFGMAWCLPLGNYKGTQANIFIRWRVTAQEDLTGKSVGYQHHLADIWSAVNQQCPSITMIRISNFVAGVRLLRHGDIELPDSDLSLEGSPQEEPVNTILVSEMRNGKFDTRMSGDTYYQSLEAAREKRNPATLVPLPPPPRPLIDSDVVLTPRVNPRPPVVAPLDPGAGQASPSINQEEPLGLDVAGLPNAENYLRIYFGEFGALQATDQFVKKRFPRLYVHAVRAYGIVCGDYLPHNSPIQTIDYSYKEGLAREEIHKRYRIEPRFFMTLMSFDAGWYVDSEAYKLIQRNDCTSHATLQFMENLLRFALDEPPVQELPLEPIKRYTTTGEFEQREKQRKSGTTSKLVKEELVRIESAMDDLARRPLLRGPSDQELVDRYYQIRDRYRSEANAVVKELGFDPVFSCIYDGHALYYWRHSRPISVTDEYIQKLSGTNPIRFIGKAIDRCPTTKPVIPIVHPTEVLANLKVQRRVPPIKTDPPAPQAMNAFNRASRLADETTTLSVPVRMLVELWEKAYKVEDEGERRQALKAVVSKAHEVSEVLNRSIRDPRSRRGSAEQLEKYRVLKNEIDDRTLELEAFIVLPSVSTPVPR